MIRREALNEVLALLKQADDVIYRDMHAQDLPFGTDELALSRRIDLCAQTVTQMLGRR